MMNRTLVAAAITALTAGTAFAQSSVTVYGRINTSGEYQKNIGAPNATTGGDSQYVLQNNASRIGFMGVEDIGGGMKVDFLAEHRFNSDTGAVTNPTAFWAGDVWVGLTTNFGYFRAGRITSAAYYATADWVSMHNHDTGTSEDKLYDYLGVNKNTIAYLTPSFGGFTVEGSVSAGEGVDSNKVYGLAGKYDGGPLQLGLGYEQESLNNDYQVGLRAAYTMGSITFGGYWQHSDKNVLGTRDAFRLSGMYAMGASEFHLNLGMADDWSNFASSRARQYTVAYNYNLSKRTKLYAFYTAVDNGDKYSYFGATGLNGEVLDPSSFALGIRHNF